MKYFLSKHDNLRSQGAVWICGAFCCRCRRRLASSRPQIVTMDSWKQLRVDHPASCFLGISVELPHSLGFSGLLCECVEMRMCRSDQRPELNVRSLDPACQRTGSHRDRKAFGTWPVSIKVLIRQHKLKRSHVSRSHLRVFRDWCKNRESSAFCGFWVVDPQLSGSLHLLKP